MLFMGEEYAETAPFQYFISHLDPVLVEAVRRGRREEFAAFGWQDLIPDPQDEGTFRRSQLRHHLKEKEPHAVMLRFYKELIRLRKEWSLGKAGKWDVREGKQDSLVLLREDSSRRLAMIFNFGDSAMTPEVPELEGLWRTRIWSADRTWNGPADPLLSEVRFSKPFALKLHPHSFALFESQLSDLERA
jgi:maltooligosyltrehalose trehalohydrolase